jgi:D-serine deaminase-like pyridoxal phosphate-dependent protein
VQTPEAARDLGRLVADLPGLELVGMMTFPSTPRAQAFFDDARELWARAWRLTKRFGGHAGAYLIMA